MLILFSLLVCFLVASIFWMITGTEPVEGDTYSTPESNVAGTIIIFGMIIVAWVRSTSKKESQDANAHPTGENPSDSDDKQPLPPDTKIPD